MSEPLARSRSATASADAWLAVLALAVVASSRFFHAFPGVDLSVSQWLYDTAEEFVSTTQHRSRC
jgi:hypothetical protein